MAISDLVFLDTARFDVTPGTARLPESDPDLTRFVAELGNNRLAVLGETLFRDGRDIEVSDPKYPVLDILGPGGASRFVPGTLTDGIAERAVALFDDGNDGALLIIRDQTFQTFEPNAPPEVHRLWLTPIDPVGNASERVQLYTSDGAAGGNFRSFAVEQASNGDILMQINAFDTPTLVRRFDADGAQVGADMPLDTLSDPAVYTEIKELIALNDNGFAYTFTSLPLQGDSPVATFVARVDATGAPLFDPVAVVTGLFSLGDGRLQLLQTNDGTLIGLRNTPLTERTGVDEIIRIAPDGTLSDPVPVTLPEGNIDTLQLVALDDGTYVLGYNSRDTPSFTSQDSYFLQSLNADGTPASAPREVFEGPASSLVRISLDDAGQIVLAALSNRGIGLRNVDTPVDVAVVARVVPVSFEDLTEGDDEFVFSAAGNVDALGGNDSITGSDGDDRIITGDGNDSIEAGAGDDTVFVAFNDTVDGGAGTDMVILNDVTPNLWRYVPTEGGGILGYLPLGRFGGLELDSAQIQLIDVETVQVNFTDGTSQTLSAGVRASFGGDGDDVLVGTDMGELMNGGAGDDRIASGAGADQVNGGTGDDFVIAGPGADIVAAGSGNDTVAAGYGDDRIWGMDGDDALLGEAGDDFIAGQIGDDRLMGGAGIDVLFGNDGDDILNGGRGSDLLHGGAGADRFHHAFGDQGGSDWIQDYSAAEGDVLVTTLSLLGSRANFQVNFANTFGAGADDVDEAFVIYRPTGQIVFALVDGAGQDEIMMADGLTTFDLL